MLHGRLKKWILICMGLNKWWIIGSFHGKHIHCTHSLLDFLRPPPEILFIRRSLFVTHVTQTQPLFVFNYYYHKSREKLTTIIKSKISENISKDIRKKQIFFTNPLLSDIKIRKVNVSWLKAILNYWTWQLSGINSASR